MTNNNKEERDEIIQELYEVPVSIFDGRYTKTTQFMLPAINLNIRDRSIFGYFENAFLDDDGEDRKHKNAIYVLFKVIDPTTPIWRTLDYTLSEKPEFLEKYPCGKKGIHNLVMYVFQVPEANIPIYIQFKRGEYSKFPDWYKKKFPQKVNDKGRIIESVIWGAIHKSPKLKAKVEKEFFLDEKDRRRFEFKDDEEIWEKPRPHREIYRYSQDKMNEYFHKIEELKSIKSKTEKNGPGEENKSDDVLGSARET